MSNRQRTMSTGSGAERPTRVSAQDVIRELDDIRGELDELRQRPKPRDFDHRVYLTIVAFIIIFFVLLAIRAFIDLRNDQDRTPSLAPYAGMMTLNERAFIEQAGDILSRAEASQTSAERILNFLEGASVLIGGALAVAAIYGFRNAQETRSELNISLEKIQRQNERLAQQSALIEAKLLEFDQHSDQVQQLLQQVQMIEINSRDLNDAYQELRNRNWRLAFNAAQRVLERSPNNIEALFISGWLKFQFIAETTLDDALADLQRAYDTGGRDRPIIGASLGVLKRRKATKVEGMERRQLFEEAEILLRQALAVSPYLLDWNSESYWAPLAGLYRDLGELHKAIEGYERAVEVTPGSSYPHGNLAALYLCRSNVEPAYAPQALNEFERTLELAQKELAAGPEDYFHMMDISMARMVLGQQDPQNYKIAHRELDAALKVARSAGMLGTSLRGWDFLHIACPDHWIDTQLNLKYGLDKIKKELENLGAEPEIFKHSITCGKGKR